MQIRHTASSSGMSSPSSSPIPDSVGTMSGTTLLVAGTFGVEGTMRYMPPNESILLKLFALNFFMFIGRDCERHM
uniref:Uncharacterized protein n=1 Tax=Arundo donax TaxID=35708 RepID=A0A0A9DEU1_ARUDO